MSIPPRRAEGEQPLDVAGSGSRVRATVVGLALGADERSSRTRGRSSGTSTLRAPLLALGEDRADDLGDHVAGAADDHGVALADVLAAHLVLVVQRGVRDGDAADEHRLEHRERRHLAGAARVNVDLPAAARCAPRAGTCTRSPTAARGWSRRAPAGARCGRPSRRRRRSPSRRCDDVASQCSRYAITPSTIGLDLATSAGPASPRRGTRRGTPSASRTGRPPRTRTSAPAARAGARRVTFGSFWRSEPAAAFRGLANGRCSARGQLLVQASNAAHRQVHLAADLEHAAAGPRRGAAAEPLRTVRTFAVMSSPTRPSPRVAPLHETPRLVSERDGDAVDLQLARVGDAGADPALDPRGPRLELLAGERVVEREHRARGARPARTGRPASRRPAGSGLSGVTSSGKRSSSARSSLMSSSYSASDTSGSSSTW